MKDKYAGERITKLARHDVELRHSVNQAKRFRHTCQLCMKHKRTCPACAGVY